MLENHFHLIPQIEREIQDLALDSIVLGLGPTGHLLPWLDRKILNGLRVWGSHDAARLWPVDDLLIFDPPQPPRLQPGTEAHDFVVRARPKRLWIFPEVVMPWAPYLHHPLASVTQQVPMLVWQRGPHGNQMDPKDWPAEPQLESPILHTGWVSPTGMTTLAWREGCRRIGLLGVDMRMWEHHTFEFSNPVDLFLTTIGKQAQDRGGVIANLSPISSLKNSRALTVEQMAACQAPA